MPEEGVYVYATSGGEEVDVLGGSRHEYPSETTITVRHAGCGLRERWDALRERWDERETCPTAAGDLLRSYVTHHEFFRQSDTRQFACDEGTHARPSASVAAGTTWTGRCVAGSTIATFRGVVVGRERLVLGGTWVETVHVRVDTSLSGDQTGASRRDVWAAVDRGLSIRERSTTETESSSPLGSVRYREEYEIMLVSLDPRR